jgi:hypothetical protein
VPSARRSGLDDGSSAAFQVDDVYLDPWKSF